MSELAEALDTCEHGEPKAFCLVCSDIEPEAVTVPRAKDLAEANELIDSLYALADYLRSELEKADHPQWVGRRKKTWDQIVSRASRGNAALELACRKLDER